MSYNAVTLDTTGQILRAGFSDFFNDGAFDGATEIFHSALTNRMLDSVDLKYQKIVASVITVMTPAEQDAVDLDPVQLANVANFYVAIYPKGEPEVLVANGAVDLMTTASRVEANNLILTLADGLIQGHFKKIIVKGAGDSAELALSLDQSVMAYIKLDLPSNSKVELIFDEDQGFWAIIDDKDITKMT